MQKAILLIFILFSNFVNAKDTPPLEEYLQLRKKYIDFKMSKDSSNMESPILSKLEITQESDTTKLLQLLRKHFGNIQLNKSAPQDINLNFSLLPGNDNSYCLEGLKLSFLGKGQEFEIIATDFKIINGSAHSHKSLKLSSLDELLQWPLRDLVCSDAAFIPVLNIQIPKAQSVDTIVGIIGFASQDDVSRAPNALACLARKNSKIFVLLNNLDKESSIFKDLICKKNAVKCYKEKILANAGIIQKLQNICINIINQIDGI